MAPIDPAQLLKALDSHLSSDGGIRSIEDVPRLASLMKKFSKKLVSRCVYCNVLQATEPDILSEYLDKGGWETINTWLQYAKSSTSQSFLLEMLKLCKLLPMTLNRLKENNTAKVIKSLTKHENAEVRNLSLELVTNWMTIIKGKKTEISIGEKKKKKVKPAKPEEKKVEEQITTKPVTESKNVSKLKGIKRPSVEKEVKKEYYEDVKIDPEPLLPVPKKPRPDRPKTVKLYQKKFRATGLEEETPLPKNISKKTSTVDKSAVAAAKSALVKMNSSVPDRITEKKIKPESLLAVNENASSNKGIKLIPAKPRPTYMLQESASFMDALTQPVVHLKRKKKPQPNKPVTSPTSPTLTAPKLQFYKDTLETSEDKKEDSPEKLDDSDNVESSESSVPRENEPMDVNEEGGQTPPNDESNVVPASPETSEDSSGYKTQKSVLDPNQLRSILSHGRRRGKKKSVKWVEDSNLKEIFYFEMDETERVNVLRAQNFGDLKSNEVKREREAIEMAKRQAGDRMEETRRWWILPILIDIPPPLVEPGSQSKEKELERMRQQSTLQEIYFTREMIPDSPHEPDLEIVAPTEPKIIPLDEVNRYTENQIGALSDFSQFEPPKPSALPEVLASLIKMNSNRSSQQPNLNASPPQMGVESNTPKQPLLSSDILNQPGLSLPVTSSYDPAEPITSLSSNSLLGPPPPIQNTYNLPSNDVQNMPPQGDWRPQEMSPPDHYFGGNYPVNPNMMHDQMQGGGMHMRPPGMNMYRPNMPKGPPPRIMGPRSRGAHRVPCRHFVAGGCRFGMKCSFLHPGFNGPQM